VPLGWDCGYSTDDFTYEINNEPVIKIDITSEDPSAGLTSVGTIEPYPEPLFKLENVRVSNWC